MGNAREGVTYDAQRSQSFPESGQSQVPDFNVSSNSIDQYIVTFQITMNNRRFVSVKIHEAL